MFFLTIGIFFLAARGVTFREFHNDRSLLRRCLVEALVLEVLCLFKGGFLLDEIEFPGIFLKVLLGELGLALPLALRVLHSLVVWLVFSPW